MLKVIPSQAGWTVDGTTVVRQVLVSHNSVTGNRVNNTQVGQIDLSVDDPSAVLELVVGRSSITDVSSPGTAPLQFRGNPAAYGLGAGAAPDSTLVDFDPAKAVFNRIMGRYFVSGYQPFVLRFTEPLESLVNPEGGTPQAFTFQVLRMDDPSPVGFNFNLWFEEY